MLAAVVVVTAGYFVVGALTVARRSTPIYDPPVLAGQIAWDVCSGGVYARLGDKVVLTITGHCASEGVVATDAAGREIGVASAPARDATCPYTGHVCAASDMAYLVLAADHIPWGHLNQIDMGVGGYRTIAAGTAGLACDDVHVGDAVEMSGRGIYRSGHVVEKGNNLKPADQDPHYFPCMIAADIRVDTGDSGSVVLDRGIPAGVTSRSFEGYLGFTPLREGLTELGLTLCDTPDCGLLAPSPST